MICVTDYDDDELANLPYCENDGIAIVCKLKKLGYEVKDMIGKVSDDSIPERSSMFFRFVMPDTTLHTHIGIIKSRFI